MCGELGEARRREAEIAGERVPSGRREVARVGLLKNKSIRFCTSGRQNKPSVKRERQWEIGREEDPESTRSEERSQLRARLVNR